jgi:hypothetical protein
MAIIQNPFYPSASTLFAEGFANRLGQGLQDLAGEKIEQLKARQGQASIAKNLEGLGLSPQDAQVFAQLPESQRSPAALDYLQQLGQQTQVAPEQVQQPVMQQLQQQPVASTEQVQGVKDLLSELGRGNQLPQMQQQNVSNRLNAESFDSLLKNALARGQIQQQQPAPLAPPTGTAPVRQLPKPPVEQPVQEAKKPLTAQQFLASRPELLGQGSISSSAALPGETPAQYEKRLRETRKEDREVSKEAREFSKPYKEAAHAAHNNIRDYDILIDAAKNGNIRSGDSQVALEKLGLQGFNRNFSTQLAEKISARLSQNARTAFGTGTRLTNFLEQTYQRSLPSLWNTKEGIIAISEINKRADEALIVKDNARKEILDQTNGRLPYNIEDQIDQRAKPQIDKLEQEAFEIAQNAVAAGAQKGKHKFVEVQKIPNDYFGRVELPNGSIIQRDKTSGLFKNVKTGKVEEL